MSESKLNATWKDGKLTVSADFAEKPAAVMLRGDGIRAGIQLTTRATSYTVDFPADNQKHTVTCKPFPGIPGFDGEAEFFAGEEDGYKLDVEKCATDGAVVRITRPEGTKPLNGLRIKAYIMGEGNAYLWCCVPVPPDGGEIEIQYTGAYGVGISLHDAESETELITPYVNIFEG